MCATARDSDINQRSAGKPRVVWWLWAAAIMAVLAILFLGRDMFGQWARHRATRDLDIWAISDAQRWLDRADRIDPADGNTELLRAKCYRHLEQWGRRAESLKLAARQGVDVLDLRNEVTLGEIQSGELSGGTGNELGELTGSGIAPADIAASFIEGRLVHQDLRQADLLWQAWAAEFPDEPHVQFIHGMLALRGGDMSRAREDFERTLILQPRHELALIAMARLYKETSQYDQAVQLYVRLARNHPANDNVLAELAQTLRQLGRIELARQILTPAMSQPDPLPAVMVEAGQIELESANFQAALRWFLRSPAKEMRNRTTLSAAATALSMLGEIPQSQRAYAWIANDATTATVLGDLRTRLELDPQDRETAGELQQLMRQLATRRADINPLALATTEDASAWSEPPGRLLYVKHCLVCHGTNGQGDGHAARFVYPRPRNLRSERMRLVSTRNGVPTRNDVMQVIRQGVPGTAMAPLEGLPDDQLEQLTDVVQQMQRDGAREKYVALLQADDEEVDSDEVDEVVAIQTTPEGIVTAPPMPAPDDSLLQLGKELYSKQSCHSCHGETGVGDVNTPLFDDLGRPAFPRDLVHEVFKGGNTPPSIYLRTLLGMPGSPHPANVSLTREDMIALALYTHSLGQEPRRKLTNHQRSSQASTRPAVEYSIEWLFVIGHSSLVIRHWSFVIGHSSLVIGHWSLASMARGQTRGSRGIELVEVSLHFPCPSVMVSNWSTWTFSTVSTPPPSQRTSTRSTWSWGPRPKWRREPQWL